MDEDDLQISALQVCLEGVEQCTIANGVAENMSSDMMAVPCGFILAKHEPMGATATRFRSKHEYVVKLDILKVVGTSPS